MNGDIAAMIETTKKLALLADALERRSAAAIESQRQAEEALRQTAADLRGDIDRLMQGSSQQVGQWVRQSVESTLGHQASQYDHAVSASTSRLSGASHAFEQTALAMSAATYRKTLASFAVIVGAMLLLIGGGALLFWFQWQIYNDARARILAAQVDAQTMEAYAQVQMTSCGGHPCVRLDAQSPRWGKHGDYLLIETGHRPNASQTPH